MKLFSIFSLRKSTHVLRHSFHLFKKKRQKLSSTTRDQIRHTLEALQTAILEKDREKADRLAKETLSLTDVHLKKSSFDHFRDLIFAIAFALTVAILVRQLWFEPYEIPTGSMRP